MTNPSVDAGEAFRRSELSWSLSRLSHLVNSGQVPVPHRIVGPLVIEFTVPEQGVDQAAQAIGRTPERYLNQYFVVLDGEEMRVRWSAHVAAEPTGLDFSREPDDPTPVSPARVPMHTGGMTEGGLVDETAAPVCQGVPAGFEAGCGTAGPHGPHAIEALSGASDRLHAKGCLGPFGQTCICRAA